MHNIWYFCSDIYRRGHVVFLSSYWFYLGGNVWSYTCVRLQERNPLASGILNMSSGLGEKRWVVGIITENFQFRQLAIYQQAGGQLVYCLCNIRFLSFDSRTFKLPRPSPLKAIRDHSTFQLWQSSYSRNFHNTLASGSMASYRALFSSLKVYRYVLFLNAFQWMSTDVYHCKGCRFSVLSWCFIASVTTFGSCTVNFEQGVIYQRR